VAGRVTTLRTSMDRTKVMRSRKCHIHYMRRAQSVRHYSRPSTAQGADDLGILKENDDSVEDVLRKQLIDKERECDKVCNN
jgi:hypothetical protein